MTDLSIGTSTTEQDPDARWRILVVDDDEDVHRVTQLALNRRQWKNKRFELIPAFSAKQGRRLLQDASQKFHVAIIDVVMETDTAGLELCNYIRSLFASSLRIILRTGQPGLAPEEEILDNYDIDHYISKMDVTDQRLYALIRACLRSNADIIAIEEANAALSLTNSELKRHAEFKSNILQELNQPDGPIAQLKSIGEIDGPIENQGAEETNQPNDWRRVVRQTVDRLTAIGEPQDFRSSIVSALDRKSVVLLLKRRQGMRLTRKALAGACPSLEAAEEWDDILTDSKRNIDLLFVDWDNISVVKDATRMNPSMMVVLLTSQSLFDRHGQDIMSLPITSAVVVSNLDSKPDPLLVQELVVTAGKLISEDIFGLEKYLSWGISVHDEKVDDSEHRTDSIQRLDDFASDCGVRPALRRKIQAVCDEFLMNALWDAPVDSAGTPKYRHLPRNKPLKVRPDEAVKLRYGFDGNLFALSVEDNFGALEREVACRYIRKCLAMGTDQVSSEPGGAGIGLYLAYISMNTFVINVFPGRRTEVIGIFDTRSIGSSRRVDRSFHYFRSC